MAPLVMRRLPPETMLQLLVDQGITTFVLDDLVRQFSFTRAMAIWRLNALQEAGRVRRFLHGRYVVCGPVEKEISREPMFLATHLVEPAYVAYGSAFHFHGWTKRAPPTTFVASPRRSRLPSVGGRPVLVVQIPSFRFFGFHTVRRGSLEFPVADPEKAIVDGLDRPRYCGGIRGVVAAAERAVDSLDLGQLEAYAIRMDGESLCSRLGYILEILGKEPRVLRGQTSKGRVKLDSLGPRQGRLNRRWNVIDNL